MKELVIIIKDDTKVKLLMEILSLMDFIEIKKKRRTPRLKKAKSTVSMTFFNLPACLRIGR